MITKNFKQFVACILQATSNSTPYGLLEVKDVSNTSRYVSSYFNRFPYSVSESFTLTASAAGISVGSGDTAATENDYQLESTITSGLTAQVNRVVGLDSGDPYIRYDVMLTNNSTNSITINEIGYKQTLSCSDTQGGTGTNSRVCLLDRTVLSSPVVIAAGEYVVIRYTLKTVVPS